MNIYLIPIEVYIESLTHFNGCKQITHPSTLIYLRMKYNDTHNKWKMRGQRMDSVISKFVLNNQQSIKPEVNKRMNQLMCTREA